MASISVSVGGTMGLDLSLGSSLTFGATSMVPSAAARKRLLCAPSFECTVNLGGRAGTFLACVHSRASVTINRGSFVCVNKKAVLATCLTLSVAWGCTRKSPSTDASRVNRVSSARGSRLAIGRFHTCTIRRDGSLWCWGDNYHGQLGVEPEVELGGPTRVGEDRSWQRISSSGQHTCAIRRDGSLWCWGNNDRGQLGVAEAQQGPGPERVGAGAKWRTVSAGGHHTCGVRADGSLWCWGANAEGELGEGTRLDRSSPVRITGQVSEGKITRGIFSGTIHKTHVNSLVLPGLARRLDLDLKGKDTDKQTRELISVLFDADRDGTVEAVEVAENALLRHFLAGDVDADGDGTCDLSVGLGFTAVSARIRDQ